MKPNIADLPDPEPLDVLKYILGRIYRTRSRQIQLTRSLDELRDWISAPIGGTKYSPTPRSHTHSDGTALTAIIRMNEIEDRYKQEQAELAEAAKGVIDIVALLPEYSLERTICHMRHVRLLKWSDIAAEIPMSRRHVSRVYDGALDTLLTFSEVQTAITEARHEYQRWIFVRKASQSKWARERSSGKNKVGGQSRKTKSEI